ncbi:MAG: hypothetical protein M3O30_16305 [Planctomycetota bacterium]|nr:hypothetical protein [Planctomycetota bacterium]
MKRKKLIIAAVVLVAIILFVLFGNHSLKTAPYSLPASPMVAFRITGQETDSHSFANDPNTLHGYAIVQKREITDPRLQQAVVNALTSRLVYGLEGDLCFEPGIAISFGDGRDRIDALICLNCRHIYFFHAGEVACTDINSTGAARIKELYAQLFPGHNPDGSDDDYQRIRAARDQERDKRLQQLIDAASEPSTQSIP